MIVRRQDQRSPIPVISKTNVEGSGTPIAPAVRMLSIANAAPGVVLNVTLALLNGIVLCIPANPPAKNGSGAALYEREPTFVVPLNKSIVVAFAIEKILSRA